MDQGLAAFAGPLLLLGILAWLWSRASSPSAAGAIAFGLVVCEMLFQWARLQREPGGWTWLGTALRSRAATSEYTGPQFYGLLMQHVPSPALGGALIGVVASFGVLVAYHFAALWTSDPARRLGAAFAYALMPGLVLALPSLEQLYPILTMLGLLLWHRAIDHPLAAIAAGLLAFVATLLAYQLALLAIPLAFYALCVLRARGWDFEVRRAIFIAAAIALATWLAANFSLAATTSFHPLDSFTAALHQRLARCPYGMSLLHNLLGLAIGGGILVVPLLAIHFARDDSRETVITFGCLVSLAMIVLAGLIRCEPARVWLFLQPLAIVPAGLTLARFKPAARGLVLGLSALLSIAIVCEPMFLRVP